MFDQLSFTNAGHFYELFILLKNWETLTADVLAVFHLMQTRLINASILIDAHRLQYKLIEDMRP